MKRLYVRACVRVCLYDCQFDLVRCKGTCVAFARRTCKTYVSAFLRIVCVVGGYRCLCCVHASMCPPVNMHVCLSVCLSVCVCLSVFVVILNVITTLI